MTGYEIIPSVIGFTLTIIFFVAIRLIIFSRSPINISGALFLFSCAFALLGYHYQIIFDDFQLMLIGQKIQVIGINFMYPTWLVFILYLTGNKRWVNRYLISTLIIFSLIPIIAINIPNIRPWFVVIEGVEKVGPFTVFKQETKWLVWFSTGIAQIQGVIGVLLLARQYNRVQKNFRFQYFLLFLTPIIEFVAIWMEISDNNPLTPVSLFNLSIIPICLIISLVISSLKIGQEEKILKENVTESMRSPIIISDSFNQMLYVNASAQKLFNIGTNFKKYKITEFVPQISNYINHSNESYVETPQMISFGDFIFDLSSFQLKDWRGVVSSQVYEFQNITDREKMEQTILERNKSMSHTNELLSGLAEINFNIQKANDISNVYEVLDYEFGKIGLGCFIMLNDEDLRLSYLTIPNVAISHLDKILGESVHNFRFDRKLYKDLYIFYDSNEDGKFVTALSNHIPFQLFSGKIEQALSLIRIDTQTSMMTFQIKTEDKKIGLLGVWGKNVRESDFPIFQLFTSQVAWAIEKNNLYQFELNRTISLSRANQLITALSKVSAMIGSSSDYNNSLEIMGEELEKLGLHCVMGVVDSNAENIIFKFSSFEKKLQSFLNKNFIPAFNFIDYKLPKKLWPGEKVITKAVPVWYHNPYNLFDKLFPFIPKPVFRKGLQTVGISDDDNLCILPVISENKVIGVLPIWGSGIQEEDTSTLLVFAYQVSEILRRNKKYEEEVERSNRLARSNAVIMALSNVAGRLETVLDLDDFYQMLGRELKKVNLNSMVGTFDADKKIIIVQYLSIMEEIKNLPERLSEFLNKEMRIPRRLWPTDKVLLEKSPYWDPNPIENWSKMFPYIPKKIFLSAVEKTGFNAQDQICYLPMISNEDVIGILGVWGKELQQDDLPGLSVFANQIATAINNTTLYQKAQEEIRIRTETEVKIQTTLNEKEILLREIHHRVKNNLQVISSLLNLQISQITDQNSIEGLRESQNRVRAMALIHEKLYQSNDLAVVDFSNYLQSLTKALVQTYRIDTHRISISVNANDVMLDLDTAIPCGLIVNELVTNSFKHAFSKETNGEIKVNCKLQTNGTYHLIVEDNGIGLLEGFDPHNSKSLGLKLVTNLVKQIGGNIETNGRKGAHFMIQFTKQNSSDS